MNTTPAQIAIANLIDLAERGEIDPWDVPVISIVDRFLAELGLIDDNPALLPEPDLPQSGQAFLWASMLVLLKADTLQLLQDELAEAEAEPEDFLAEEFEELLTEDTAERSLPANLEQLIRRRTSIKPVGKRRVTLQELIEQLEHIAAEIEAVGTDARPKRSSRSRSAAIKAIAQLAHNENLTELAAQLEQFLYVNIPKLSPGSEEVDWEQFLQWWHRREDNQETADHQENLDRAGVFWALLLLSAQSKVELSQEEFYQDLIIRPLLS